jgi:hypothetical protein
MYSTPRDDLALAAMNVGSIERAAGAPAHQEPRSAPADRVVAAAARGGLARFVFRQAREVKNVAPGLPGGRDLVRVGTRAERNGEGGIAMNQHQHLRIVNAAQRDADKIADANVDGHPHALDGTAQHDAFTVKFDLPHAAVCAGVLRMEQKRKRKRVEPQRTARPGGMLPACCCLTPHRLYLPAGIMFPVDARTLAGAFPFWLKKAG